MNRAKEHTCKGIHMLVDSGVSVCRCVSVSEGTPGGMGGRYTNRDHPHTHTFSVISFSVLCFSSAAACGIVGNASVERSTARPQTYT